MLKIIDDTEVMEITDIIEKYLGFASLVTDVEWPSEDEIQGLYKGKVYAIADKDDFLRLHEMSRELRAKGYKTIVNICGLNYSDCKHIV